MNKLAKWAFVFVLFVAFQLIAFSQRGYYAVGGEIFVIAVPAWVALYKALAKRC